jgi:transposase-like protein
MDSRELPALEASYSRGRPNVLTFFKRALRICTNNLLVVVDRGPCNRWTLERLRLEYRHNSIERFFRYLEKRMAAFHHRVSARKHIQRITIFKQFLNQFTLYYATRVVEMSENAYPDTTHLVFTRT